MNAIATVADLHVTSEDRTPLVDGVSLTVAPRESLGIVGESGSGKSLTLKALMGILPPTVTHASGTVHATRAAMVFQEPATALNPTMRVGTFVALTWRKHHPGRGRRDAQAAALTLFQQVGIPRAEQVMKNYPHELSGGMRQRVVIAAALATDPDVLLCDEPTTALDVRVQAQILTLLRQLVEERDLAVIFVSHDLAVVAQMCDRIMVMRHGQVIETGPTLDLVTAPTHEYTRELIEANLASRQHPVQEDRS